jgi:hypothetical protein
MGEPVTDIDKRLAADLRATHRGRWTAVAAALVLLMAGLAALGYTVVSDMHRLQASCSFYKVTGTVSPALSPPMAEVGVAFIISARSAYIGQGCGSLPPPSPALVQLAARYGLSLP